MTIEFGSSEALSILKADKERERQEQLQAKIAGGRYIVSKVSIFVPDDDDDKFDDEGEAEGAALAWSIDDSVYQILDQDENLVVALVWQQEIYRP